MWLPMVYSIFNVSQKNANNGAYPSNGALDHVNKHHESSEADVAYHVCLRAKYRLSILARVSAKLALRSNEQVNGT